MDANTVTLERALNETRTGDIWLFRGDSGPDRAIQTMTNAPVNHVGMTVAIDDMPPLMWHAELGDKLLDMWTGTNHRGVQLNDARAAVERWINNYGQRCWLRQLTPDATREQEDQVLRVIARMDGTPFPSTARLTGRWFRGRVPTAAIGPEVSRSWTRGFASPLERRRADERNGLETAYCAETVAITYEEMGLLTTEKHTSWFDPGKFWSGDLLPLTQGYKLTDEIAVVLG